MHENKTSCENMLEWLSEKSCRAYGPVAVELVWDLGLESSGGLFEIDEIALNDCHYKEEYINIINKVKSTGITKI